MMFTILCTSTWCDEPEDIIQVTFENKSNDNVFTSDVHVLPNDDTIIDNGAILTYPAELMPIVFKNKTYLYSVWREKYYQLNVYKQSTFDKYTREEMIENNICDKIFVLSYEELEAMNFKIVYTGND